MLLTQGAGEYWGMYGRYEYKSIERVTSRSDHKQVPATQASLLHGGRLMSSFELTDRTAAVTAALVGVGLHPDDRVLVMLADGPCFAEVFAGVTRLGALALPVNPQLSAAEVIAIAAQTGAWLVVGSAQRDQTITNDLETTSLVLMDGSRGLWAAVLRLR